MTRPDRLRLLVLAAALLLLPGCAGSPRTRCLSGNWTRLDPANPPGPRLSPLAWTGPAGTLWMFGGIGPAGCLSDLWRFDGKSWTLVKGVPDSPASPSYGAPGIPAAGNLPPGRVRGVTWVDPRGRLLLYGGFGRDLVGGWAVFSDMWMFDGVDFAWAGGSQTPNLAPTYGPRGKASPQSDPGARSRSAWWTDREGRLWLYGGANRGDLWSFDGKLWSWEGGSVECETGWSCRKPGNPSPGDFPGARNAGVAWVDGSGEFLLFGGEGWDDQGQLTIRSDLWRFSPAKGQWALVEPDQGPDQAATDGRPPPRMYAAAAPDGKGGAWLFGGTPPGPAGPLDDLWKATRTGWLSAVGPSGASRPSPRRGALGWTGPAGEFYLFGGEGPNPDGSGPGFLNDLWVFRETAP